jgi:hypothetical protein
MNNFCPTTYKKRHYQELQPYRIQEILLVSSLYDAFIFEEDGELTERLLSDYKDLNLHFSPRITQASSFKKALDMMKEKKYDLVITTLQEDKKELIGFSKKVKKRSSITSTIFLTHDSSKLDLNFKSELFKNFDGVFSWAGDTKLFLALIKLIEDKLNFEEDIKVADVRGILVVEDSIRNYSSFLPKFYNQVMNQTRELMSLSLNSEKRIFRMRARPKVLLARNYEEAIKIVKKYKENLIGIISDIKFCKNEKLDPEAGFKLIKEIKKIIPDIPTLLHSSDIKNREKALEISDNFLDKSSSSLLKDIELFIKNHLGFGDFVFRLPNGKTVDKAKNTIEMEQKLRTVPPESIIYHAKRNHFSIWFMARGEFLLSNRLRPKKIEEFKNINEIRTFLIESLENNRKSSTSGVIADFSQNRFNTGCNFLKISGGSLGGKARGLAFMSNLLNHPRMKKIKEKYENTEIIVPRTAVIGIEEFEHFMEENNFYDFAYKENDKEKLSKKFLSTELSEELHEDLFLFLKQVKKPIAVRSSSILEDSHSQPFAGIYSTYILPNSHEKIDKRLKQLTDAIKLIYSSTYYADAKSYIKSTNNRIEEEKMGIVIQELVGKNHGDIFYPDFSGVVRSINFFPFAHAKQEDGIAYVALGLGKSIMEGENVLQFSPHYPEIIPQIEKAGFSIKNTQRHFYALDMLNPDKKLYWNETITLKRERINRAEKDGTLEAIGSTYVLEDDLIKDGIYHKGIKFISFAHILKSKVFPLCEIIKDIISMGKEGFGRDVEIEFAVNLSKDSKEKNKFYFLQIRPMITGKENSEIKIKSYEKKELLCKSNNALGNGVFKDIKDIIYVKPESFDSSKTTEIANKIGEINEKLKDPSIFIGLGRWGTSDPWLGIPVSWNQISNSKVLVEVATDGFNIDPSNGSHFFHNITSLGLAYLTISNKEDDKNFIDWNWLKDLEAIYEDKFIKHIKLKNPLKTIVNGKKGKAIILKS